MATTIFAGKRTLATHLQTLPDGTPVMINGWIHRRRQLAELTFLMIRDRSGLAQVVAREPAVRAQLGVLGEETPVSITGRVSRNSAAPGGVEVVEPVVTTLSEPAATPPVQLWRPVQPESLPTRLDHAPVALRHRRGKAAWELAAASVRGFRETLSALDFTEICTPKLVGTATESGANVFELDYFGRPAFLAQSPHRPAEGRRNRIEK